MNDAYVTKAILSGMCLEIFCPISLKTPKKTNIKWIPVDNPLVEFIKYHNSLNEFPSWRKDDVVIGKDCRISCEASVGHPGMRYIKDKFGSIIEMHHSGNVVIKDRVVIGEKTTIARATLDSTVIGEDTKIGCNVAIGHNCIIGARNIIIDGTVILGSVVTGDDCYIGGNATIRNGISIASNTMIGMGAVVVKNIDHSGFVHAGNPSYPIKEWNGEWI